MRISTFLLLFIAAWSQAQVNLSSAQLDFGDVYTTADKELAVNVTNTTSNTLEIDKVKVFHTDFSYSVPSATLAAGATKKVRVTFKPKHNLAYNSELIFVLSDGSEHRIDLVGNGRFEDSYYNATFNKSHEDLKSALKSIISAGYTNLGYSGARDKMYSDIDNVDGKVTCVYTGRVATFNTRSGANSNNFNCEHTWPQSLFNKSEPERADIHHLFPTDNPANGRRGSYPFGIVSSANWSEGGSKLGGGLFEPRDEQKGATARAMMYFALRYQDYSNFIDGQEAVLKQWHVDHGPSARDVQRNNKIYTYQKNRNPFVDHPEFIERINKIGSTDVKPTIKQAETTQTAVNFKSVAPADKRDIYIVNTGNVDWTGASNATNSSGRINIISTDASAAAGEAIKITVGFTETAEGTYTDNLTLNLSSQAGKIIIIPVTYTIGLVDVENVVVKRIKSHYSPLRQHLSFNDMPEDVENIEIYTSGGKQILLDEIYSSFTDIPFRGHGQGVYFVVIKTKTEVFTSRFLVY
ncbi:endonuclease [Bacteroidia bacterium]|nr:endonuclease [Bacteroidia bacterium]